MRERGKERGRRKHKGGDTEGGDKQGEVCGGVMKREDGEGAREERSTQGETR